MKTIYATGNAPKAIGPYSQAVGFGNLLFLSGQIPLDPSTGQMTGGSVAEQTERVMENLKAVLEAAGSSMDRVLKTTIYLVDMQDFAAMNEVYGRYFPENPPARATIMVRGLPRDARVEIEAIAAR